MKKRILGMVLLTAFLMSVSTAMAYDVRVNIDGPAIAANCTEMYVEFIVKDNSHYGSKFWPQFDRDGKITSVIVNYWGANNPYTVDPSSATFTVKSIPKGLVRIKAKTCHGKNVEKGFGGSTDDQTIFIRSDHIDKL